jgi:hypothetical protein
MNKQLETARKYNVSGSKRPKMETSVTGNMPIP